MLRELNISQEMVDRIFPRLDDLLEIHVTFLLSLIGAQKLSADKSIEEIGEILLLQVVRKEKQLVTVIEYSYIKGRIWLYLQCGVWRGVEWKRIPDHCLLTSLPTPTDLLYAQQEDKFRSH